MSSQPLSSSSAPALSTAIASSKKNKGEELNDFLASLDAYRPTVPDGLTSYYLERAGVDIKDERIVKLVSLAADKVLTEIIFEAKQIAHLRAQASKSSKRKADDPSRPSVALELEDIAGSLAEMRVCFRRKKGKASEV